MLFHPSTSLYRPSGGGAFSPLSLPGLVGWYDASDAASITQSSSLVSQWNDKSGNARHMVQATGSAQPTYGATSFNTSYPGITFDGSSDFMTTTFSVSSAAWSCFVAMKVNTVTGFGRIVSLTSTPAIQDSNSTSTYALLLLSSGLGSYFNSSGRATKTITPTDTSPIIGASVNDGTNNTIYVGGSAGTPVALAATAFNPGGATFGQNNGGSFYTGILSEVIITTGDQSANISAINTYLAAKWGL